MSALVLLALALGVPCRWAAGFTEVLTGSSHLRETSLTSCSRRVLLRRAPANTGTRRGAGVVQRAVLLEPEMKLVETKSSRNADGIHSIVGYGGGEGGKGDEEAGAHKSTQSWPRGECEANSMALAAPLDHAWVDSEGELNPYKVLGLRFLASKEDVREAYAHICKTEHPDLNGGRESERWLRAREAYTLLTTSGKEYAVTKTAKSVVSLTGALANAALTIGSLIVGGVAASAASAASSVTVVASHVAASAEDAKAAASTSVAEVSVAEGAARRRVPMAANLAEERAEAKKELRGVGTRLDEVEAFAKKLEQRIGRMREIKARSIIG